MKALSLIFRGVDKGAIKTASRLNEQMGSLNKNVDKSPKLFSRLGTAMGALGLANLDRIADRVSTLEGAVTGAGVGVADQIVSWKQLEGRLTAGGESAKAVGNVFGTINDLMMQTNKSSDELSGMFQAFRESSGGAEEAADSMKRYGAFVAASDIDAKEFASSLSILSGTWKFTNEQTQDAIDRTMATAKAWKMGDKAALLFTKAVESADKVYNSLTGEFALSEDIMKNVGQQTANIAGLMRKMNKSINPEEAVGMTDAFFKMRQEFQNIGAGQVPDYLDQVAIGVGMGVDRMRELVKTDPQTFFNELMTSIKKQPKEIFNNVKLMGLLKDNLGLSEGAIYALKEGLDAGNLSMSDLSNNLVDSKNAFGATNKFVKQSNVGLKTFNETLATTRQITARKIMSGLNKDLNDTAKTISKFSAKAGNDIGRLIKEGGPFGEFLKFTFLLKEQGATAAFAVVGNDVIKFAKKTKALEGVVPYLEKFNERFSFFAGMMAGIDPVQFAAVTIAVVQFGKVLGGVIPMLARIPALLVGLGPWLLAIGGAFLLVNRAMDKAGVKFGDFFDKSKSKDAFKKTFEAIPEVLDDVFKKYLPIVADKFVDLLGYLGKMLPKIGDYLVDNLPKISNKLAVAIEWLTQNITKLIEEKWPTIVDKALVIIGGIMYYMWKLMPKVIDTLLVIIGGIMVGAFKVIIALLKPVWDEIVNAVKGWVAGLVNVFKGIGSAIVEAFVGIKDFLGDFFKALGAGFKAAINPWSGMTGAEAFQKSINDSKRSRVLARFNELKTSGGGISQDEESEVRSLAQELSGVIQSLKDININVSLGANESGLLKWLEIKEKSAVRYQGAQ